MSPVDQKLSWIRRTDPTPGVSKVHLKGHKMINKISNLENILFIFPNFSLHWFH